MSRRQKLSISNNQFEATWMRTIEMHVIDKIIGIINKNENEILQKIKIMNVLNNPQLFIMLQDRYKSSEDGICNNYMNFGEQYCQNFTLNYEDYFSYIESKVRQQQTVSNSVFRSNYYNFISLFHIWNFNIDLDYTLNAINYADIPMKPVTKDYETFYLGDTGKSFLILLKIREKSDYLVKKFTREKGIY